MTHRHLENGQTVLTQVSSQKRRLEADDLMNLFLLTQVMLRFCGKKSWAWHPPVGLQGRSFSVQPWFMPGDLEMPPGTSVTSANWVLQLYGGGFGEEIQPLNYCVHALPVVCRRALATQWAHPLVQVVHGAHKFFPCIACAHCSLGLDQLTAHPGLGELGAADALQNVVIGAARKTKASCYCISPWLWSQKFTVGSVMRNIRGSEADRVQKQQRKTGAGQGKYLLSFLWSLIKPALPESRATLQAVNTHTLRLPQKSLPTSVNRELQEIKAVGN